MAVAVLDEGGEEDPEEVVDAEEMRGEVEKEPEEGFVALR
jgi:hypothetical protein